MGEDEIILSLLEEQLQPRHSARGTVPPGCQLMHGRADSPSRAVPATFDFAMSK